MCGIFGAMVVEKGAELNIEVLKELAIINEERGNHAFGFCSTNNRVFKSWKRPGKPSALVQHIAREILPGATAFIGHTRWANVGNPRHNYNNHPHRVPSMSDPEKNEGCIVHNGTVVRHNVIAERFDLQLKTHCDSEVIGRLLSAPALYAGSGSGRLSTLKRARMVAEAIDCPSTFMFLSSKRFAAVRMGRPLWWHKYNGVVYFSSIPVDFDGEFLRGSINDNAVRTYNWSEPDGRWKLVGRADITRGTRPDGGAKETKSELEQDWRTAGSGKSDRTAPAGYSPAQLHMNAYGKRRGAELARRGNSTPQSTRESIADTVARLRDLESNRPLAGGMPEWKRIADEFKAAKAREQGKGTNAHEDK